MRRKREGKAPLIDPDLFRSRAYRLGISGQGLHHPQSIGPSASS